MSASSVVADAKREMEKGMTEPKPKKEHYAKKYQRMLNEANTTIANLKLENQRLVSLLKDDPHNDADDVGNDTPKGKDDPPDDGDDSPKGDDSPSSSDDGPYFSALVAVCREQDMFVSDFIEAPFLPDLTNFGDLKFYLEGKAGIPQEQQTLFFDDFEYQLHQVITPGMVQEEVPMDHLLIEYNIHEGLHVLLFVRENVEVVPRFHINIRQVFDNLLLGAEVHNGMSVRNLTFLMGGSQQMYSDIMRLIFRDEVLTDDQLLGDIGLEADNVVLMAIQGQGGAPNPRVLKHHLKKEDAIKGYKKRVDETYKVEQTEGFDEGILPTQFKEFLTELEGKMTEFLMLKNRAGSSFFEICIKHIPNDQLNYFQSLLTPKKKGDKGKNLTNDEKLHRLLHSVFKPLEVLERCSEKIEITKGEMVATLMKSFIEENHVFNEGTGVLTTDVSKLLKAVEDEISARGRTTQPELVEASASNCIVQ